MTVIFSHVLFLLTLCCILFTSNSVMKTQSWAAELMVLLPPWKWKFTQDEMSAQHFPRQCECQKVLSEMSHKKELHQKILWYLTPKSSVMSVQFEFSFGKKDGFFNLAEIFFIFWMVRRSSFHLKTEVKRSLNIPIDYWRIFEREHNEVFGKFTCKQESPPAWTQEAYRPPCSEYSFCCPILADAPQLTDPPLAHWPPPDWVSWLTPPGWLTPQLTDPPPAEPADWPPP